MFRAIPELAGNSILLPLQNSLNDFCYFFSLVFIYLFMKLKLVPQRANFIITLLNTS